MKTVYFILGMHRSGTSALGGVLNAMGLNVGSELMPANETNPKGYFENRLVYWHNEKIFKENGSSWHDYTFMVENINEEKRRNYINEAKEIIEKEYRYSNQFIIKDPRICMLFPIWEAACKELSIKIKIILPYRNPFEVVESLKSRNGFSYEKSLILWSHHFYQAELLSRTYERSFLSFDELIDNMEQYVEALSDFTGFQIDKKTYSKVEQFIEKDFKHINLSLDNLSKEMPLFLLNTIEMIKKGIFTNKRSIDKNRKEFYYNLEFFHNKEIVHLFTELNEKTKKELSLIVAQNKQKEKIEDLQDFKVVSEKKLKILNVEFDEQAIKRIELNKLINNQKVKLLELTETVSKSNKKLDRHQSKRAELNGVIQDLRSELANHKDADSKSLDEYQSKRTELNGVIQDLRSELVNHKDTESKVLKEHQNKRIELNGVIQDLRSELVNHKDTESKVLKEHQNKRIELNAVIQDLRNELVNFKEVESKSKDSLEDLQNKRVELNKVIQGLRSELTNLKNQLIETQNKAQILSELNKRFEIKNNKLKESSALKKKTFKKKEKTLLSTNFSLTEDLDKTSRRCESIESANLNLVDDLNKSDTELQQLIKTNKILKKDYYDQQKELKDLKAKLDSQNNYYKQELRLLTTENREYHSKYNNISLKQLDNQKALIQNIELTKSKIGSAIKEYARAWDKNLKKETYFQNKKSNNIKQFHSLFTNHIGTKESERELLSGEIQKIRSGVFSYLNPLRLSNLFLRLNRLNEKLKTLENKFNSIPWEIVENFNNEDYLRQNIDVKNAIHAGDFKSALEHFIFCGYDEIKQGNRLMYKNSLHYSQPPINRGSSEETENYNKYLNKQNKHLHDTAVLEVRDLLVDVDFSLLENIEFSSMSKTSILEHKDLDVVTAKKPREKDKLPQVTINRWLNKRGINLHVYEHKMLSASKELKEESNPSKPNITMDKYLLGENTSIEVYSNKENSNKTIVFSQAQDVRGLEEYVKHNGVTIVCFGAIYNQELIHKVQPSEVICVFAESQGSIQSVDLELPKQLKKWYRINATIEKTKSIKKSSTLKLIDLDKVKLEDANIFKNNIESISATGINGWIFNKNDKSKQALVNLHVVINGETCVSSQNNLKRTDVKKAYQLECSSGFQIEIPTKFLDGKNHNLKLVAEFNNKYHLIKASKFSATSPWTLDEKVKGMRVLFCTHNLRSQGAQNSLFELAIGLKRLYGIVPIVHSPAEGPLINKYKEHGVKTIIDKSFSVDVDCIDQWDNQVSSLSSKIKQLKCDILVANTLQTFFMIHAAHQINIPTAWIPRESEPPKDYFNYLSKTIKHEAEKTFSLVSQVVFVADATRQLWNFMQDKRPFRVIHNSLNTSLLSQDSIYSKAEIRKSFGIKQDDVVLLSLGTVAPRKGQLDFVKALPKIIANSEKPVKAFIIGMGSKVNGKLDDYTQSVLDLVDSYPKDVQKQIFLIPETDKQVNTKTYDFYALADIFIFTSRIESFPRVILEALYFGLPVVATPCFGVVEQCIENYNAYYYDEEDIRSLETNTLKLVNNEMLRKEFSHASNQLFKDMQTYDQMLKNYYDVITKINKKGNQ